MPDKGNAMGHDHGPGQGDGPSAFRDWQLNLARPASTWDFLE